MRPHLAVAAAAFALSACVSQDLTPFPANYDAVSASERAPDDRYTVVYRGSPDMPASEVLDLALLRASAITLQKDGDWFEVVTDYSRTDTRKQTAFQADPFARRVQQTANCGVLGCTTSATPEEGSGDIERVRESQPFVTQSLEIIVHYGDMPVGTDGYDAVATSESIRARYQKDEVE
ncbi:MAG: hypothetical protein AAF683_11265 [Pseudomonadota bacterium]